MAHGIRELKVWQEAVALGGEVTRLVHRHARRETRTLTEQLLEAALRLGGAVADGSSRPSPTEQRQLFRAARRALLHVETYLAIARSAELVPAATAAQLASRAATVGRLLAGYLSYLDRQVEEEHRALAERPPVALELPAGTPPPRADQAADGPARAAALSSGCGSAPARTAR